MPLNEASVVMMPLPSAISNTVPSVGRAAVLGGAEEIAAAVLDQAAIGIGPVGAVERGERGDDAAAVGDLEHRAVAGRAARLRWCRRDCRCCPRPGRRTGSAPLVPLNEASVVMVPLPCTISKTVPSPDAPPAAMVVPKRLPLLSSTRPLLGSSPFVPLNEASVVMVPLPVDDLEHRAVIPDAPPVDGGAEEIAAAVLDQAGVGLAPFVPLNEASVVMVPLPGRSRTPCRRRTRRRASVVPKRLPLLSSTRPASGIGPVGAVERGEGGDGAAAWAISNTVPSPYAPPPVGGAEEIAAAVLDQAAIGIGPRSCR